MIALAGQEVVRRRGGDLDGYRRAMFSRWHERDDGTIEDLWALIARYTSGTIAEREVADGLVALAASHDEAQMAGVFGTLTVSVGGAAGLFVKLADLPPDAAAVALWRHVRGVGEGHPELLEVERAVPGG